jgi:glycerol-3-phosphate dehydrogenase
LHKPGHGNGEVRRADFGSTPIMPGASPPRTRDHLWQTILEVKGSGSSYWDLIVIGGGIIGAGILREAARRGRSVLLLEKKDFAWGASSRSSKMVHGGLRYLLAGNIGLTYHCLRERERLQREAPGLVDPLGFVYPHYRRRKPGRWSFMALLGVYDLLAGGRTRRYCPVHELNLLTPRLRQQDLKGGACSGDAVTDDARLVLRVIREGQRNGAVALNYVSVEGLLRQNNRICGVAVKDGLSGATAELPARVVINATGAWADRLGVEAGGRSRIRALRGSHLVFPFWRIPVAQTVALKHPGDGRPVFMMPWEGVTIVGNTDLDHEECLDCEPRITEGEVAYLLDLVHDTFPGLEIGRGDILATFAGIRSVIRTGVLNPSKERRNHSIWEEKGLVSVTGGKLTTFRLIALEVLQKAEKTRSLRSARESRKPIFAMGREKDTRWKDLDVSIQRRLLGRYGPEVQEVLECASCGELSRIPGTDNIWAELRWSARNEAVVHLEDLLLRRSRLGLLLPEMGMASSRKIRNICQSELGWNDAKWEEEAEAYRAVWMRSYGVPEP